MWFLAIFAIVLVLFSAWLVRVLIGCVQIGLVAVTMLSYVFYRVCLRSLSWLFKRSVGAIGSAKVSTL